MVVTSADIELRYSIPGAAAGNDDPQPDPNDSLGEFLATNEPTSAVANDVFRDLTGAEGGTGITIYRCLFVGNYHATDTAFAGKAYVPSQSAGGATVSIGLDPAGASAIDSGSPQAEVIASETAAPAGVTFSAPSTSATGLDIGDLAAEECAAIWLRLVLDADSEPMEADQVILAVSFLAEP